MQIALLVGRLVLAAVFATAAMAKLGDLPGSRRAVAAFGVPERFARILGLGLPLLELGAAAMLASSPLDGAVASAGTLLAASMLALFSGAILLNLALGRTPECHCFGQLHSAPAGPRTLLRNGGLLVLAVFVISGGQAAWTIGAAVAMVVVVAAAAALVRKSGPGPRPADREGLAVGSRAPGFELPALDAVSLSLGDLLSRGRPVLLVFTDPNCGPCVALAPEIAVWQRDHAEHVTIAVIENRDPSSATPPDAHGRLDVLLQRDDEVAGAYRIQGTPAAVLIESDGTVASGVAPGRAAIQGLLGSVVPGVQPAVAAGALTGVASQLGRRELLARAAAAGAAVATAITPSAWATVLTIERKCRHERCGGRCCPKGARCRRRKGRKVCVCRDGRRACGKHCCPRKAKCRKVGKKRICVCRDGRRACGNRCCPDTYVCRRRGHPRRRRCVCPEGYTECGGRCVSTRTDPRHCGRCGRECPTGTSCVDGECARGDGTGTGPGGSGSCDCPPGETCCEGQCTDLNSSEEHCGECGKACPAGKTCCDGHCIDLESDPKNCGSCGKRCPDNEVCSEGECRRRCARGLKNCGGRCIDPKTDRSHCGRCGRQCGEGYACCNGSCCSYNAGTCCGDGCKNLAFDGNNCGECGNVCGPNEYCRFGVCTCPLGVDCD